MTMSDVVTKLNEQHKIFCNQYVLTWKKARSYMKAFPLSTYESAAASANRLLKCAKIIEYIEELKKDIEGLTGVSKVRNVHELAKIAYSSIAHLHETWISLKEFDDITDEQKEAIESIETKTEQKVLNGDGDREIDIETKFVKIKLYSKIAAIDKINEMMGYKAPDKIEGNLKITDLSAITTDELVLRAKAIDKIEKNDKEDK